MKTNVKVRILESDFDLVCDASKKEILVKSAEFLNNHLKTYRRNNPAIDSEQLALIGALRATCELFGELQTSSEQAKEANEQMQNALNSFGLPN